MQVAGTVDVKDSPRLARAGLLLLLLALGWLAIGVYAVHPALPPNAVSLPGAELLRARVWLPEGWAFFTRDPREEDIFIFRQQGGVWQAVDFGPSSRPAYVFGLRRKPRAMYIELGLVMAGIPRRGWAECSVDPLICVTGSATTFAVSNPSPLPAFCGLHALVLRRPVPWAWSQAQVAMPSKVARVNISC